MTVRDIVVGGGVFFAIVFKHTHTYLVKNLGQFEHVSGAVDRIDENGFIEGWAFPANTEKGVVGGVVRIVLVHVPHGEEESLEQCGTVRDLCFVEMVQGLWQETNLHVGRRRR